MFQILLTPSAGKRLIGKATVASPSFTGALKHKKIVIIAGTTNGYVAEEFLSATGQSAGFNRSRFIRGITLPPAAKTTATGRLPVESGFPGDVVLEKGVWKKGKTIYDVIDGLKEGDVIIKGANCVDMTGARAGILIGHPKGGTILTVLQAVVGRRVRLVLPVGLEKRIADDIDDVAAVLNAPGSTGLRLMPVAGEIITEITAVENMFIAAHALGLGARIYTGPVANVNANLKVELEIPAGHRAVALLRVGAVDKPVDAVTAASGRRAVSETVNYSRVR